MSAKHTPGPWRVLPPSHGIDANFHVTDAGDTFVAHVFGFNHAVDQQSEINAKLIAAAPDLLAALEGLLSVGDSVTFQQRARETARAAIANAKGSEA